MRIVNDYSTEARGLIKDIQQLAVYSGLAYGEVMHMSLEERQVLSEIVQEKFELDAKMAGLKMKSQVRM